MDETLPRGSGARLLFFLLTDVFFESTSDGRQIDQTGRWQHEMRQRRERAAPSVDDRCVLWPFLEKEREGHIYVVCVVTFLRLAQRVHQSVELASGRCGEQGEEEHDRRRAHCHSAQGRCLLAQQTTQITDIAAIRELQELEFNEYVAEVEACFVEHKEQKTVNRPRMFSTATYASLSQRRTRPRAISLYLGAKALATAKKRKRTLQTGGLSEEQLLAQQEALFASARAAQQP